MIKQDIQLMNILFAINRYFMPVEQNANKHQQCQ